MIEQVFFLFINIHDRIGGVKQELSRRQKSQKVPAPARVLMVGVRVGGGGGSTDIMRGPFFQDFLFQTQDTVYTPVYGAFIRRRDVAGNA